jgi:hypothetical protein
MDLMPENRGLPPEAVVVREVSKEVIPPYVPSSPPGFASSRSKRQSAEPEEERAGFASTKR